MTNFVYDDQHPNGRVVISGGTGGTTENWDEGITLSDKFHILHQRLDRIENLLVTILGHVEPQNIQINSDFLKGIQGEDQ